METRLNKAAFDRMEIYRFSRYDLAQSFADPAVKAMMVLLGEDERYWVVSMANAWRFLEACYEVAPRI